MNIIAFDTSSEILHTGIRTDKGLFKESINSGLKHSEHLLLSISDLLTKSKIAYKDVELIVCTRGPGSFTGLRIGMATAKGLSTGIKCPIVSVNTLDVIADTVKNTSNIVVPVLDARKKRIYTAIYENGKACSDYLDISPLELFEKLKAFNNIEFCGPGVDIIREDFKDDLDSFPFSYSFNYEMDDLINSLIRLGENQFNRVGPDPDNSGPYYIRLSDAEIKNIH